MADYRGLERKRGRQEKSEKHLMMAGPRGAGLEDGRGHKPRNVSISRPWKRQEILYCHS